MNADDTDLAHILSILHRRDRCLTMKFEIWMMSQEGEIWERAVLGLLFSSTHAWKVLSSSLHAHSLLSFS